MYIIKNAFKSIGRSKSRNVLIGIIALVIAVSACIGLSIRQASQSAKDSALEGMSITGKISYDRGSMMEQIGGFNPGSFDPGSFDPDSFKDDFSNMMGGASSLTLEEYELYATAKSVLDFYYTLTVYFNGSEGFDPVSNESSSEDDDSSSSFPSGFPGGMGGMMGGMLSSGDFTIVGYSGDNAITSFINGNASILEGGAMFDEGTEELVCVISEELAMYNGISVGDTIVVTNPSLEEETYELTVTGIYSSNETNNFSSSMFGASQDPANQIYMSAAALQKIIDASEENSSSYALEGNLSATYVFADVNDYEAFEDEARALGLDESYTVSSSDISAFERSLAPLETLGTMALWFLIVILVIGGVILVVLNVFNVRERKYEVGVLTAMGMKKWKVATQFVCEILIVTMVAVVIGAGIGAVSSVPITNALLAQQVESQSNKQTQIEDGFGRPGGMGGMSGGSFPSDMPTDMPDNFGGGNMFENMFSGTAKFITEVDSAMNLTVVFQMIGVGLLLTLIASSASVMFIMRYDPLKILANRD